MAINLLPPIRKEEIKDEILRKKISLVLFLLGINLCLLMAFIFALRLYIKSKNVEVDFQIIQLENRINEPQFEALKKQIDTANKNLNKISNIKREQVSSVDVLERVALLLPKEAYLQGFSFLNSFLDVEDKETKETARYFFAKIRIGGVALNRETVFLFKQLLDDEELFESVYFDPFSWVKANNAEFMVDLTYPPIPLLKTN